MNPVEETLRKNITLAAYAAASFAIGIPFGLAAYPLIQERMPELLKTVYGGIISGSEIETIGKVFMRNATASLVMMLAGVTVIVPLALLAVNGFMVGIVLMYALGKGIPLTSIVLGILPHGIMELPAIFIAAAVGMRVGLEIILRKGRRIPAAAEAAKAAAATYLALVVPLLVLAAVVEILLSRKLIG